MAQDDAMMFPNDRIRTWLANNRANSPTISQSLHTSPETTGLEELTHELDPTDPLDPEVGD